MTHRDVLLIGFAMLSLVLGLLLWRELGRRHAASETSSHRILFPFDEHTLSISALDVTLRIARAERATLVPDYLAVVPMRASLEGPLPRKAGIAMPLFDKIESRAAKIGVPVDARIEPGRSYRHALKRAFAQEQLDRVVVSAKSANGHGFGSDDIAWMLDHSEAELLVLRAAPDSPVSVPVA